MKLSTYVQPLDQFAGELLILPVFQEDRPLPGAAGLADWRLNGFLSRQLQSGAFAAEADETLLTTSQGRLPCGWVLLYGLGMRRQATRATFFSLLKGTLRTLEKMGIARAGLCLGEGAFFPANIEDAAHIVEEIAHRQEMPLDPLWFDRLELHLLFPQTLHWSHRLPLHEASAEIRGEDLFPSAR